MTQWTEGRWSAAGPRRLPWDPAASAVGSLLPGHLQWVPCSATRKGWTLGPLAPCSSRLARRPCTQALPRKPAWGQFLDQALHLLVSAGKTVTLLLFASKDDMGKREQSGVTVAF